MSKKIYYFIDTEEQKFHFFESREKAKEFSEDLPTEELVIDGKVINENAKKFPMYQRELRHYYGTVYVAYNWEKSGTIHYELFGRWKDAKRYRDEYKIKKFELTPYDEYMNNDDEEKEEKKAEKKVKRRSPF